MEQKNLTVETNLVKRPSVEERKKYQQKPTLLNQPGYNPEVTKATPHPKLGHSRGKYNSTATIFMKDAIKAPDVDEIIKCLAKSLYWTIKSLETKENKIFLPIFSEENHPLGDNFDITRSPSIEDIEKFIGIVFDAQDLSAENGVMCAAYIERLVKLTGVTLNGTNWRRILLSSLILASKVWEDLAVWNADFLSVFPNLTIDDLNRLERDFLMHLQFTVTLNSTVYAKYYFDLRALSEKTEDNFPLKPLSQNKAEDLEAKTRGLEESTKRKHVHYTQSKSLNPYTGPNTSLSVEELSKTYGKNWSD